MPTGIRLTMLEIDWLNTGCILIRLLTTWINTRLIMSWRTGADIFHVNFWLGIAKDTILNQWRLLMQYTGLVHSHLKIWLNHLKKKSPVEILAKSSQEE